MNTPSSHVLHHARPWPVRALAFWLIDACAIILLSLVMLAVNEFRPGPGGATAE